MGKKNNIVFNLTIDDLKELGIIKSKRRRKRKNRIMQYMQPNNNKSTSNHMNGFTNVSNLQTENLRLQNNILDKYPLISNLPFSLSFQLGLTSKMHHRLACGGAQQSRSAIQHRSTQSKLKILIFSFIATPSPQEGAATSFLRQNNLMMQGSQ